MNTRRLGDLLVDSRLITNDQLLNALKLQKTLNKKLGEVLIEKGFVTEGQIIEVLEFQLGIPHMDLDKHFIDPEIPKLINENLARRHVLIPIKKERGQIVVAMADPLNIYAIDDIKIATGFEVEPVISTRQGILNAIDGYYGKQNAERAVEDFKKQYKVENISEVDENTINEINNAPVVRLINTIIKQAVKERASDIHIEPFKNIVRVRFRIDGELQEIMTPSKSTHSAIITRIKIMGKMDIAERRVPQDGRVEMSFNGRDVDLRFSVLPTVYGEKIVIRLLDRSRFLIAKGDLRFSKQNLMLFNSIIQSPNGIILVTGPTGSGKTTTLYMVLREMNDSSKNIITVEDPVEYRLHGVNQVPVNSKAGLNFANALRSILRQDPDIIMIGEIRDAETAQIAVRAAITGHLVLSTMHTNDTVSTITRLMDMGIEPYLLSSSVIGVISQRLVRQICSECKERYLPNETERNILKINEGMFLYRGRGCSICNYTGYKERRAIHEIMPINRKIRIQMNNRESSDFIRQASYENGTINLKENCRELVIGGITTINEFLKVTYSLE